MELFPHKPEPEAWCAVAVATRGAPAPHSTMPTGLPTGHNKKKEVGKPGSTPQTEGERRRSGAKSGWCGHAPSRTAKPCCHPKGTRTRKQANHETGNPCHLPKWLAHFTCLSVACALDCNLHSTAPAYRTAGMRDFRPACGDNSAVGQSPGSALQSTSYQTPPSADKKICLSACIQVHFCEQVGKAMIQTTAK